MKKDIEWLKESVFSRKKSSELNVKTHEGVLADDFESRAIAYEKVLKLIDQLDEPEVLSQEWISEHEEQEEMYGTYGVPVRKLQNLLVPKQELVEENKRLNGLLITMQEEVDRAYKDGYEKGKQHTFYKGYLEGLADKENEPETVADVISDFWKSYE